MRVPIQDMTIVIRSAGERTLVACQTLVRQAVASAGGNPDQQVVTIAERPFAAAVRRTFEIGLEHGREWVAAMDADVLLLGDAMERIRAMCACADGATFTITPRVLCKFFGGFCCKGLHVYPMHMLDKARREIDACGSAGDLRPEGAVARAMAGKGLHSFGPPVVVGVHDYEQSFLHIYLKSRLRARREAADGGGAGQERSDSLPFVAGRAGEGVGGLGDADYLVAMWGMLDGQADAARGDAPAHYDWNGAYPKLAERMRAHGLAEKPAFDGVASGLAERLIGSHDFGTDGCTPVWVRRRFGFDGDRGLVLARLGVATFGSGRERTMEPALRFMRRAS